MDRNFQRQVAVDLAGIGRDAGRRQITGLQALKGQVKIGTNIGSLIPLIEEVAKSSEADRQTRLEACSLLAECLNNLQLREKCSAFNEIQSALWSCVSSLDEQVAVISLVALSSLASEDFIDFIHGLGYDNLSSRILDHRLPAVRAHGINYFGVAIVRAWAWVALLQDEGIRDMCVDMLRAIFSRLSECNGDRATQAAIGNVLDHVIAAYLSVTPMSFAPLPLLHVAWQFGTVYATLFVELMRDLENMLDVLCEGAEKMVSSTCIWLPSDERGPITADAEVLALEAASLRASLLWILVGAGGLARRYPDGDSSADRNGSLIWELVREGCKQKVKTRSTSEIPQPRALQGLLQKTLSATLRQTNNWALRFCMCRATIMQPILAFVSGEPDVADKLLQAASGAFEIGGKASNASTPILKRFCSEVCCSVMAIWPMLECKQADAQILQQFAKSCAPVVALSASTVSWKGAKPPLGLQCVGLAARALVQILARLSSSGHAADLKQLLPELSSGQGDHPFANMLCRECANLKSPELAEVVLRLCLPQILRDAAQRRKADAQAATWRALSLIRRTGIAGGQNHAHAIAKILTSALTPDVMGSPHVVCMAVAALSDIGQSASAGAVRDKAFEAARSQASHGDESFRSLDNYYKLLGEAIRTSSRKHHLSAFLCAPEVALQSAFYLHASSDSLALEAIHSSLSENSKTLSGPPLMISTQLKANWPRPKCSHVAIRVDIFNVTGVSFNNVKLELAISSHGQRGRAQLDSLWSYAEGRTRPVDHTLESLHCRQSSVVWRDLHIYAIRPLCITLVLSYDNTVPEVSSAPGEQMTSPNNANADVWSEDEDEENDKLRFACHPLRLPLSVFFAPFYGFDSSAGGVFPPPIIYIACPHTSKSLGVSNAGTDLRSWRPAGFHRLIPDQDDLKIEDVHTCYAGVAFDEESVLCFLCKTTAEGNEQLEIRTSAQGLLNELIPDLYSWILSDLD